MFVAAVGPLHLFSLLPGTVFLPGLHVAVLFFSLKPSLNAAPQGDLPDDRMEGSPSAFLSLHPALLALLLSKHQ